MSKETNEINYMCMIDEIARSCRALVKSKPELLTDPRVEDFPIIEYVELLGERLQQRLIKPQTVCLESNCVPRLSENKVIFLNV